MRNIAEQQRAQVPSSQSQCNEICRTIATVMKACAMPPQCLDYRALTMLWRFLEM